MLRSSSRAAAKAAIWPRGWVSHSCHTRGRMDRGHPLKGCRLPGRGRRPAHSTATGEPNGPTRLAGCGVLPRASRSSPATVRPPGRVQR